MSTARAHSRTAYYAQVRDALGAGRLREFYDSLVVDDEALARGLRGGTLVLDTRLRDALDSIRGEGATRFALPPTNGRLTFTRPSVVDEAAYAVDVAALGEAEVVRVQRRLDQLEPRLVALERRFPARVSRTLRGAAKKLLRRNSAQVA